MSGLVRVSWLLVPSSPVRWPRFALSQQCRDDFGSPVVCYNLRYWRQEETEARHHKEVRTGEPPRHVMPCKVPVLPPQVASVGDVVTVTGLRPALEYHYCVQAVNAVGVGHWSAAESFSTLSSSPSQVGVFKVVRQTTNSITLTWATPLDNGDPISYYHIECGSRTISVEAAQTEVTVADLTPDTTYRSVCPRQCLLLSVH